MKGIIKFKLNKFEHNIISSDIIDYIKLKTFDNKIFIIDKQNIYYDNYFDVTAYIDNLDENINSITISNSFGGEIKVKHIINIQGSESSTMNFLKDNIEKIILFPFFKLFEIFYAASSNREKYSKLKEENFGEDFKNIKTLEPFEIQIQTLNELLFFSRPDILGKFESKFIEKFIVEDLDKNQKKSLHYLFAMYYVTAIEMQKNQNINCIDSEKDSIAKEYSFPQKIINDKELKKLFMCKRDCFKSDNCILATLDKSFIQNFFIEQLIKNVLQKIESEIELFLNNDNNGSKFREFLNKNIGNYYRKYIVPNIHFILILILSSIESGDYIEFNHEINWEKISQAFNNVPSKLFYLMFLTPHHFDKFFEKNFEKFYKSSKIEEIHMKNLYFKTRTKNIINSNISPNNFNSKDNFLSKINKIIEFSKFSEKQKYGEEYYLKFLELLNNYPNNNPEDIEISIYDNLKKENDKNGQNFLEIKEMMNDVINDEESKKGFLALVRQSFLLGKLRTNIVSNNILIFFFIL